MTPLELILYGGTAILTGGTIILTAYYFFRRGETDPEDEQDD